jgi:hypothetical protein
MTVPFLTPELICLRVEYLAFNKKQLLAFSSDECYDFAANSGAEGVLRGVCKHTTSLCSETECCKLCLPEPPHI